jgi:isopenicillin N synthase-like dioxygenase
MTHMTIENTTPAGAMEELQKESRMGGEGTVTTERPIRRIDLTDFESRKAEIADELWDAAVDVGFFQIINHGIDIEAVRGAFAMSAAFFALPADVKANYPLEKSLNSGWEFKSQIRPSIGVPDEKESYQITLPNMAGLWPSDEVLEGFNTTIMDFERQCWELAMRVLSCFAVKLDFPSDFFAIAHDPEAADYQSALRLLHYFAIPEEARGVDAPWRAGAHTDFDVLTLLFQQEGQGGLQVLPGREMESEAWTPVTPSEDAITCNIGDMLMRWSDDQLPSNFHRVRGPRTDENQDARYSIAFFAQANKNVIMESPTGKWDPITAYDYLLQRIQANYGK